MEVLHFNLLLLPKSTLKFCSTLQDLIMTSWPNQCLLRQHRTAAWTTRSPTKLSRDCSSPENTPSASTLPRCTAHCSAGCAKQVESRICFWVKITHQPPARSQHQDDSVKQFELNFQLHDHIELCQKSFFPCILLYFIYLFVLCLMNFQMLCCTNCFWSPTNNWKQNYDCVSQFTCLIPGLD